MGLETATYISDLDPTNPRGTDFLNQADDHMRLIKQVLQNSFINTTYPIDFNAVGVWGGITGTLSDQTDLQNALDLKAPIDAPTFTGVAEFGGTTQFGDDTGFVSLFLEGGATSDTLVRFRQNNNEVGQVGYVNGITGVRLQSDGQIILQTGGFNDALTLGNTGAATFASLVTVQGNQLSVGTGNSTVSYTLNAGPAADIDFIFQVSGSEQARFSYDNSADQFVFSGAGLSLDQTTLNQSAAIFSTTVAATAVPVVQIFHNDATATGPAIYAYQANAAANILELNNAGGTVFNVTSTGNINMDGSLNISPPVGNPAVADIAAPASQTATLNVRSNGNALGSSFEIIQDVTNDTYLNNKPAANLFLAIGGTPGITLDSSLNTTLAGTLTAQGIEAVNTSLELGVVGNSHTIRRGVADQSLTISGGIGTGSRAIFYGPTNASNANDLYLRNDGGTFFFFDESAGSLNLYSGTGAKSLALSIDTSQIATFSQSSIHGGNDTNLVVLQRGSDTGSFALLGGGSTLSAPYIELYGPSHATLAGDIAFRRNNSNNAGYWDESNTRWVFSGSEIRLGNFHFDVDQSVGAPQDDYILKYNNATGLISLEAPAAGSIGGTIADNQVAFGSATANSIEGNAQFTFDPTVTTGHMLLLNEGLTPPRTTGNLVRITAFNNGPTGDLVHLETGAAVTSGSTLRIQHGNNDRAVDIQTSSSTAPGLYVETPSFASSYTSHFLAQGTTFGAAVFGEANSQIAHGGYFYKNVANPTGAVLRARTVSTADSSGTPVVLIESASVNSGAEGILLNMTGKGSGVEVYSGAIKVANNGGTQFSVDPLISTRLAANESTTANSTAWKTPTGFIWYAIPDGAFKVEVFLQFFTTSTSPDLLFRLTSGTNYQGTVEGVLSYNGAGQTIGKKIVGWNNGTSWLGYQYYATVGADPRPVQQQSNLTLDTFGSVTWKLHLTFYLNFTGSTPGTIAFQVANAVAAAGQNHTLQEGCWMLVHRIGG